MSFTQLNLNPALVKAVQGCGYKEPTPVQAQAIPAAIAGHDIIASAQTGTGKTAAFVLPALHRLVSAQQPSRKPRVLILTPTRELATQVTEAVYKYSKTMRFQTVSIVGGMPYHQQLRALSKPLDIIVATPGRLMDHIERGRLDLSAIELVVLDEADRMLDMGFIDAVEEIVDLTPNSRQTLLFSATVDGRLAKLAAHILKTPLRIQIEADTKAAATIEQRLHLVDDIEHKNKLLNHLLANENIEKAIIFSATKLNAEQLAMQLRHQGYPAQALHGDLKQSQRNRTLEQLRRGKLRLLVATDVAARGIDVNGISHVINYDLPKFAEDYVHRIGRTGRAGEEGIAISLVNSNDSIHIKRIERYTGQAIDATVIAGLEPRSRFERRAPAKKGKRPPAAKGRSYGKSFGFKAKTAANSASGTPFARPKKRANQQRSESHY